MTTFPTVHLNGTSVDALITENMAAYKAVRAAVEALAQAYPNGRDFYPQGHSAIVAAMKEHDSRRNRLASVLEELEAICENIVDQRDARSSRRAS